MVERTQNFRIAALVAAFAWLTPGCGFVPKTRVDDAQKLVQSLRSDNARLKDTSVSLKSQNQDLSQRAVDDARSIRALEAVNDQYERSIQGYQEDREQYQAAFRDLQAGSRSTARP